MWKYSDRKAKRIENGVSVCEWQWGVGEREKQSKINDQKSRRKIEENRRKHLEIFVHTEFKVLELITVVHIFGGLEKEKESTEGRSSCESKITKAIGRFCSFLYKKERSVW